MYSGWQLPKANSPVRFLRNRSLLVITNPVGVAYGCRCCSTESLLSSVPVMISMNSAGLLFELRQLWGRSA